MVGADGVKDSGNGSGDDMGNDLWNDLGDLGCMGWVYANPTSANTAGDPALKFRYLDLLFNDDLQFSPPYLARRCFSSRVQS